MFEDLFPNSRVLARYRDAPLFEDRLRYLTHCADAGARDSTLRKIAGHQLHLARLLDLPPKQGISMGRIEDAAQAWAQPGERRSRQPATQEARTRFVGHAVRWLRYAHWLEESAIQRHAHARELAAFVEWMRVERGWAAATIRGCGRTVEHFLRRLGAEGTALASLRITHIDQEIMRYQARGCNRVSIRDYAERLRTFLHYAEQRGWCRPGLASGILPSRTHPGEALPKGLDRDEVERLLASSEGDRPTDIRDRAVLLLLSTYGLRAGEVCGLQLDDLDWQQETLRVRCPKPGRSHLYPLAASVGQALLRYLREVRPARPERTLFWTLNAPLRPLAGSAVSCIVHSRLDRLGVTGKRRGAHALRHATAQRLLDQGLSMKQVGDYLGHRSVRSTAIYAKVRLASLREVADIDLEGLA